MCFNFSAADANREVRQQVVPEESLVILHQLLLAIWRLQKRWFSLVTYPTHIEPAMHFTAGAHSVVSGFYFDQGYGLPLTRSILLKSTDSRVVFLQSKKNQWIRFIHHLHGRWALTNKTFQTSWILTTFEITLITFHLKTNGFRIRLLNH